MRHYKFVAMVAVQHIPCTVSAGDHRLVLLQQPYEHTISSMLCSKHTASVVLYCAEAASMAIDALLSSKILDAVQYAKHAASNGTALCSLIKDKLLNAPRALFWYVLHASN